MIIHKKKGSRQLLDNDSGISIQPVLRKILDKFVYYVIYICDCMKRL